MIRTVSCPSCGSPIELPYRAARITTCSACDTVSAITRDGLDATGKTAALSDFMSALRTGAGGRFEGRGFLTLGRARYAYRDGYWDEWFVLFDDGSEAWIDEDEGELTLLQISTEGEPPPGYDALQTGRTARVGGRDMYITERRTATVDGVEGQLPRDVRPGAPVRYVEGTAGTTAMKLAELDGVASIFIGRVIDPDTLVLD